MKLKNLLTTFLLIIGINTLASDLSNKEKTVLVLEKAFNKNQDRSVLKYVNDKKYIQHNLQAANGKNGLVGYLDYLKGKDIETKVIRAFEDNNYVVAQSLSRYENSYSHIIDIFRFENGLMVEHWDNIESIKNKDLINNFPTTIKDIEKTKSNKDIVKKHINNKEYGKNHLLLGKGEFVLAVNETKSNGKEIALYELFFVKRNKIEKSWKIKEEILPKDKWQNSNGKF